MNTPLKFPPPPRTVRGGPGCAIWGVRVFILPHMAVGVVMIGLLLMTLAVALFGTDVPATLTNIHTSHSRKGGTIYHVGYTYRFAGRDYTNSGTVGAQTYSQLKRASAEDAPPATLRVRHFELGPIHYQVLTEEHSAWNSVVPLLCFVLFWHGILSVFVYLVWVSPIRTARLIRHGEAAPGAIVKVRESRGNKSTSYYATFRFNDPATGTEIQREMRLPGRAQYDLAQPGVAVTVLFDPRKPRRALVYEFSGYRVSETEPPQ